MPVAPMQTKANIIPCLRYRDAPAAIEWLCSTFGFEQHMVVPGDGNTVVHAQLAFGNGMIMLGSADSIDSEYAKLIKQPGDIGGAQTQTVYVVVEDADAVYNRVLDARAQIVMDIKDEDYGGRGFTCRDPEGHIWSFGTYDPFA
jgi:uncharacterized glyoxalase superfamily protein PhnB